MMSAANDGGLPLRAGERSREIQEGFTEVEVGRSVTGPETGRKARERAERESPGRRKVPSKVRSRAYLVEGMRMSKASGQGP